MVTDDVQLSVMVEEMRRTYETGSDEYWILNVGDIKPGEIAMELFLKQAWDVETYGSDVIESKFLTELGKRDFHLSDEMAAEFAAAMDEYYQLTGIKKQAFFYIYMITCSNTVYGEGRWLKGDNWYFDIAEAGDHTITIYARESGIVLHQIMLTQNKDEAVTDGVEQAVSVRGAYEIHEIFKEVDGEVTIELSSALENSKYAYSTAGRAGDLEETFLWERSTGYDGVQVYPDMGITWGTNNISPKVSYQVEFSTPGEYYVMLYSSFKDDASDSVYVSVNNGAIMNCASSFAKGPEKWLGDTAWKINIPYAGVHTINVYPREDGARLHTLLLTQNPEPVQTLVFGDSYTSQTYWKSFDEQLASIGGQTIGVSGSEVGLWIKSVEAMKIYEPKNLVINIGVNDINRGQSGTDCGNEIMTLLGSLQSAFPDSNIFYVSICDNTQYPDLWTEYAASNEIVKAYIDSAENLHYIDYAAAMKAEADNMTNSGFSDGLHPNSDGYALLAQMICDAVTEANQE